VAAIDGPCLGGACELASLCDIVLAAPRATFGQPEIDLGCFPPVGAVTLPRLMGKAASAMVLGGEPLSAAEAARLGLVTAVVDDLAGETDRWVTRLSAKSGTALAGARRALRAGACGSLGDALERTERLYRDHPGVVQVWGGVHCTIAPEEAIKVCKIVCQGDRFRQVFIQFESPGNIP
jgi:cyclohexa-1,5-dienecarbonyl-CoA hydratase